MPIRLGCHKWTFMHASVREAAQMVRALGFDLMDLGNGPDFDPAYIAEHCREEAERIRRVKEEFGLAFVDAFPQIEPAFANNHPDPEHRRRYRRIFDAFFDFAAEVGLAGVTLSPGRYWPGEPAEESFKRAAEELRWAVERGARRGLSVRIEPHIQSVTWRPDLAVKMVEEVPGLSLTLDHSHFVFLGIPYDQIAVAHPHATHWHARQARPGEAQCKGKVGEIDFRRIVDDLKASGYDGVICLEYVYGEWMRQDNVDCVTETIALRDELRRYLQTPA